MVRGSWPSLTLQKLQIWVRTRLRGRSWTHGSAQHTGLIEIAIAHNVVVVVLHGHICGLSEKILLAYCPPLYYLSSCLPALRGQFILGISCTLP